MNLMVKMTIYGPAKSYKDIKILKGIRKNEIAIINKNTSIVIFYIYYTEETKSI